MVILSVNPRQLEQDNRPSNLWIYKYLVPATSEAYLKKLSLKNPSIIPSFGFIQSEGSYLD